ncbi:hypothetical protein G4Y79_09890 [Phototrophicus methaneseepsis]|uniref:GAF domain-containing protein n=1 Tax=Phototrophicus methaneseepsis TaxID=2710758 RepID=A0A7S8ECX5_9CHLR|nr:hypothetical protein [Phototrophicus methaneseepsis]QPC84665.1 hypothetical protein G4Y79_09890 [Phototrophicus methaneseepsis]
MNNAHLANFLQLAKRVTQAERGLVVDGSETVVAMVGLDEDTLQTGNLQTLIRQTVRDALDENRAILSNNIIRDPSEAPDTNTAFRNLRLMVGIPVGHGGVVYLDKQVRNGVILRKDIEQLQRFGQYLIEHELTGMDADAMYEHYQQMNAPAS